ncbi:MAG: glycosyltransferase [Candidatus Magasanikbacteria bacterium]|nr:glycosyltransferase [Candidatus Magasanikbacteria bacterium]
MKKIHIVHIIPTLSFGGAERFVVDLANNYDENKFETTIIVLKNYTPLKKELKRSVRVITVKKKGKISFGLFKLLRKKLKILKPDVIHTHLFGGDFWGRVVAHKMGIPVVTTEHNINTDESFFKKRIKILLKNYSDVYTAPSKAVVEFMKKEYKLKKPVHKIRHGIKLERFAKIKPAKIKKNFKLLILGRLVEQKGHKNALSALVGLKDFKWHLTIVGDGEKKKEIISMSKKLGIFDRISIQKPTTNVPELLKNFNIMIIPSNWEGLGIVAMEAMASGRVVVASATGGLVEVVRNMENGLLFENGRYDDLRSRLHWLFSHPHSGEELAKSAKNFALHHFGVEEMVKKYEEIYLSLARK